MFSVEVWSNEGLPREEGASRNPEGGETRYLLVQSDGIGTTINSSAELGDFRFNLEWNMYGTLSEG